MALGLGLQKSLWYESGHGAVRILRRQGCSGRGHGSSRARCCGAAALGRVGCTPSLSCVPRPVRQGAAPCRGAGRDVACAAGLDGGGVQGRASRCVGRLVTRAAVCPVASDRQQQPFRDADRPGAGSQPGLAGTRPEPAPCGARHACTARLSGGAGRDLRGPVALFGDLLSGVELAQAGLDARLFAGAGRVGALARERATEGGLRVRTSNAGPGGALRHAGTARVAGGAVAGLGADHGAACSLKRRHLGIEVLIRGRDPGITDAGG